MKKKRQRNGWTILLLTMASAGQVMKPYSNGQVSTLNSNTPLEVAESLGEMSGSGTKVLLSWEDRPNFTPDYYIVTYSDDGMKTWRRVNVPQENTVSFGGRVTTAWEDISPSGCGFFKPTVIGVRNSP